jgi:hypothetical protein
MQQENEYISPNLDIDAQVLGAACHNPSLFLEGNGKIAIV